jgi:predicted extracellular nuclease
LAESEGEYRIQPTETVSFSRINTRPPAPAAPAIDRVRVALFDTGDYFNGDGHGSGFSTIRGADSAEEFARQRAKMISALLAINADIIGLLSLENDGYESDGALQDLVNGLNDAAAEGTTYMFVDPPVAKMGDNEIAVGLLYRAGRVNPQGQASILDSPSFDQANILPLVQSFTADESGGSFLLAISQFHNRDQCPPPADANGDQHDGQDCWNAFRVREANELAGFLETVPSNNRDRDILIIGNLNAYIQEDPVAALESAGFMSLSRQFIDGGYTSVENGESGTLLDAFASPTLAARVKTVQQWHINADEPALLDYRLTNPPSLFSAKPYRSAENDPLLIDLLLTDERYDTGKIFFPVLIMPKP